MELPSEPARVGPPRCPAHERVAVATCARCGSFLCGECTELLGESAVCAACFTRLERRGGVSWALTLTVTLQLVALLSTPVLPLPVLNLLAGGSGLLVASREVRQWESGPPSLRARLVVGGTRVLAGLNLGLALLLGALLARLLLGH